MTNLQVVELEVEHLFQIELRPEQSYWYEHFSDPGSVQEYVKLLRDFYKAK